ncbi:MAG: hypothetical protein EOM22_00285 [Gammaproteobacteria bacterium]|nr:hypothetical protein [Gammaproteobacteria bacterium]
MISRVVIALKRLHQDERGDIPVGQLAVIGLIVIPLVIALIIFRDELLGWLRERWDEVKGADTAPPF